MRTMITHTQCTVHTPTPTRLRVRVLIFILNDPLISILNNSLHDTVYFDVLWDACKNLHARPTDITLCPSFDTCSTMHSIHPFDHQQLLQRNMSRIHLGFC